MRVTLPSTFTTSSTLDVQVVVFRITNSLDGDGEAAVERRRAADVQPVLAQARELGAVLGDVEGVAVGGLLVGIVGGVVVTVEEKKLASRPSAGGGAALKDAHFRDELRAAVPLLDLDAVEADDVAHFSGAGRFSREAKNCTCTSVKVRESSPERMSCTVGSAILTWDM